ncbi:MAG: mercury transporter [Myxococcota bacterium]
MRANRSLRVGATGTAVAALVCFTPLVAGGLGALGLAAWFPQIDSVFHLVFGVSLGIAIYGGYQILRRRNEPSEAD